MSDINQASTPESVEGQIWAIVDMTAEICAHGETWGVFSNGFIKDPAQVVIRQAMIDARDEAVTALTRLVERARLTSIKEVN